MFGKMLVNEDSKWLNTSTDNKCTNKEKIDKWLMLFRNIFVS